ncbi:MAG: hypothetical protein HY899_02550 [Deltaproteobacteria bacterium]|nr:hypothetical protein [Deltaproteobacteria bacterium]
MYKRSSIVLAIVMLLVCLDTGRASAQALEIVESAWTSGVHDLQYVDKLGPNVPQHPLYLWLRVAADEGALRELEKKNMLPMRNRWRYYAGIGTESESREVIDEIHLGVGTAELVAKLEREIAASPDGKFDWRVWSMKSRIRPGDWVVEVVYSDAGSTPVPCRSQATNALEPCRFEIRVQ